ncbi:MAG: hypothetical protein DMD91_28265 [Candidatus Rokuibacteriota bacterium]|nr:MAG: hypothetical protein DMD91_28265 [Candidatus Rokubacteria bacterium]
MNVAGSPRSCLTRPSITTDSRRKARVMIGRWTVIVPGAIDDLTNSRSPTESVLCNDPGRPSSVNCGAGAPAAG